MGPLCLVGLFWYCDHLVGKKRAVQLLFFSCFVTYVPLVIICFLFILLEMVGYFLLLLHFLVILLTINTFTLSGLFYHNSLDQSFSSNRTSVWFLLLLCLIEIALVNANSVDPDQMPHSLASYLDLYCLTITILGVSRLKWVTLVKNVSFLQFHR